MNFWQKVGIYREMILEPKYHEKEACHSFFSQNKMKLMEKKLTFRFQMSSKKKS